MFRHNRADLNRTELEKFFKDYCKKWCYQLERGDTGYEHYQGHFSLIKKRRKAELVKLFLKPDWFNWCEPMSNVGRMADATFYSMKADTRIDGPWQDPKSTQQQEYIPRQYRNLELRQWQEDLLEISMKFDDRAIYYLYDPNGNMGKSTLAAVADLHHGAIDLPPCLDGERLVATACDILTAKSCRDPKIMFVDMPRTQSKEKLNGLFAAIEQLKKGKAYDLRHEYREWWFDSPAIWVFSNDPPPNSAMSRDRWRFYRIHNDRLERVTSYESNEPFIPE